MRSNNKKVLGAVAVAGVVAMTGSAFTAGGLVNNADDTFAGGTVKQNVAGASLDSVAYTVVDNKITNVALDTDAAAGSLVSIAFTGSTLTYNCPVADVDGKSDCTPVDEAIVNSAATELSITVLAA